MSDRLVMTHGPKPFQTDLDELVVTDCTVHLERMDDDAWCLVIDRGHPRNGSVSVLANITGTVRLDEREGLEATYVPTT